MIQTIINTRGEHVCCFGQEAPTAPLKASEFQSRAKPMSTPKTETICPQELKALFPCFFDIQIGSLIDILQIPPQLMKEARAETNTLKAWPFVKVKAGAYKTGWADIKQMRGEAIERASPLMRTCLFLAERKAILMRALYMPKHQECLVACIPFPNIPPHAELERAALQQKRKSHAPTTAEILSYRRIPSIRRLQEIASILPCLVDLPIRILSRDVLGISHYTLRGIRKEVGLEDWPFEQVHRDKQTGVPSAEEVARLRDDTLMQQLPNTFKARVLLQAKKLARIPLRKRTPHPVQEAEPAIVIMEPVQSPEWLEYYGILGPETGDEPAVQPFLLDDTPLFEWDDSGIQMSEDDQEFWRTICDMP